MSKLKQVRTDLGMGEEALSSCHFQSRPDLLIPASSGLAGTDGNSHLPQLFLSLCSLVRPRKTLYHMPKRPYAIVLLTQLHLCHALFEFCGGCLVSARKVLNNLVVVFGRLLEVPLLVLDLSEVEECVAGQIGIRIELYIIVEFLARDLHFSGVVVPQRIVVEHVRRRRLLLRSLLLCLSLR